MTKEIDWNQLSDDRKVLEKNSPKIMSALLDKYGYSQEEVNDINTRFYIQTEYEKIVDWLRQGSARERRLADLYFVSEVDNLERVHNIMNGNVEGFTAKDMRLLKILGFSISET